MEIVLRQTGSMPIDITRNPLNAYISMNIKITKNQSPLIFFSLLKLKHWLVLNNRTHLIPTPLLL